MILAHTMAEALKKIVIVEDNVAANHLLRDWLSVNYEVICFLDAESAISQLQPVADRIVFLLDYNLPGLTGIELKQRVCHNYPQGRYILISGLFDARLTLEARTAGFDALIPKPFPLPNISKKVAELFGVPPKKSLLERVRQTTDKPTPA
ncbi:MAG: response regulator [Candidatus Methylacidiphilales bacterium]|nr:response regulator [Candidatus Methylacidiphilales bacterium]